MGGPDEPNFRDEGWSEQTLGLATFRTAAPTQRQSLMQGTPALCRRLPCQATTWREYEISLMMRSCCSLYKHLAALGSLFAMERELHKQ